MCELGISIGGQLEAGDVLLLTGALGAGKTALTQGIGEALGINGITSPTFVISRIHNGKIPLIHVDAYRLLGEPAALFDDLDLESQIPFAITVVEWGDGFVDRISDEFLKISIEFGIDDTDREVTLLGHGERWIGFHA